MWSTYVLLAVSVACANAFSTGAPEDACRKMKPHHHGLKAQKSTPPYIITTSEEAARGGSPIEVVISGKTPQNTIRGLLVQGRDSDDKIVGTFKVGPNDPLLQLLDCGAPGNAVTHKQHDPAADKQTVTVTWIPPPNFNGEVKFRATVVADFDTFWVKIPSAPLKVSS